MTKDRPPFSAAHLEALAALAALRRARRRAESIAAATGTCLVEMQDGEIVLVRPGGTEPLSKGWYVAVTWRGTIPLPYLKNFPT